MTGDLVVVGVGVAVVFLALVVTAKLAVNAWTLWLTRSGAAAALGARASKRWGASALLVDVAIALVTSLDAHITSVVVEGFDRRRALRFLGLTSTLRAPVVLLLALLVVSLGAPGIALAVAVVVTCVVWALVIARVVGDAALAPASVALNERDGTVLRAAWSTTWAQLSPSILRVVLICAVGAWRFVDGVTPESIGAAGWVCLSAAVAVLVRADALVMLPVSIGNYYAGTDPESTIAFTLISGACSNYALDVVEGHLTSSAGALWSKAARLGFAPLVAVALGALAWATSP